MVRFGTATTRSRCLKVFNTSPISSGETATCSLVRSPNCSSRLLNPRFVVLHYTASGTFDGTVAWLCTPASKVSAHYVIGRKGECENIVPVTKCAWHAGISRYKGVAGLNLYSIGIEMVSWGPLVQDEHGFRAASGPARVPANEVWSGPHPDGGAYQHWHKFSAPQIAKMEEVVRQLFQQFPSIREVVGHRHIAPKRKQDPWPLNVTDVNKRYGKDANAFTDVGGQSIIGA